jgi:hypothetical protein
MKKVITSFAVLTMLTLVSCNSQTKSVNEEVKTESVEVQSQEQDPKINIGSTYSFDSFHQIQFKSGGRYWIYQKPLGCGGEGDWSQSGDKVTLGPNDSNCESTRKIQGEFLIEDIVN